MKKRVVCGMIGLCSMLLCGCGSYPDLTESQQAMVAEYAAGVLLKHSETANYRLVEIDEMNVNDESIDEVVEENNGKENVVVPDNNIGSLEDEILIDEESSQTMEELLGLDGITIKFDSYSVVDSYPEESDVYFSLDASEGCKLLIIKYNFTNHLDKMKEIDVMQYSPIFKVSLDGTVFQTVLPTMLLDDMSTYTGDMESGENLKLVLVSEWKEEEIAEMSNLSLYVKTEETSGRYAVK